MIIMIQVKDIKSLVFSYEAEKPWLGLQHAWRNGLGPIYGSWTRKLETDSDRLCNIWMYKYTMYVWYIYIYILYVNIICIYIYMYIYFLRNNVLPYMNLMKYFDGLQYLNILTLDFFFKKRFVFALKWCLLRHRVLDTITIAYINHDPRVGCFFQWPCKSAIVRCSWKLGWCQAY